MQSKSCILLFLLSLGTIITAMEIKHDEETFPLAPTKKTSTNEVQPEELLTQALQENETINPDSILQKYKRHTKRFLRNPVTFLGLYCATEKEREDALVKYITNQPLTLNGKNLDDTLGEQMAPSIRKMFEDNQRTEAQNYLDSTKENLHERNEDIGCALGGWTIGLGFDLLSIACLPPPTGAFVGTSVGVVFTVCGCGRILCPNV